MNKLAIVLLAAAAHGQSKNPADTLKGNFDYIHNKVLEMAQDFPADKYNYKLKPEMRTFGAVIVHIASGDVYAGKAGMGEKVKWDELDPAKFPTKAACVELLKNSITAANAAIKANPLGPRQGPRAIFIRAATLLGTLRPASLLLSRQRSDSPGITS
jgi:hypothetical protein